MVNSDGTITCTPSPDSNGTDTFTYAVEDGSGGSATVAVTVGVEPEGNDSVEFDADGPAPEVTPAVIPATSDDTGFDGDTNRLPETGLDVSLLAMVGSL